MIIDEIKLKEYKLKFKRPLQIKGKKFNHRKGIIIIISDKNGNKGYGEISPLSGFHDENLDQVLNQLRDSMEILKTQYFRKYLFIGGKPSSHPLRNMQLFPSVRFGLEMALMHLSFLRMSGLSEKSVLKINPEAKEIPLNKMIPANIRLTKEYIEEIISKGYKSIKLKVGYKKNSDADTDRVLKLKSLLPPSVTIRLDANACWDTKEAIDFGLKIGPEKIEYIEDPLKNIEDYFRFYKKTSIPVALDGSLKDVLITYGNDGIDSRFIKAIILKPDVSGGFYNSYKIICIAKKKNIKVALSNSMQSGLSIMMISFFAAQMNLINYPMGLDTADLFIKDLISENIPVSNGSINIEKVICLLRNIKFNNLENL